MATTPGPTSTERLLAERYVAILDYVGRCAQAMDGGNWHYLRDKVAPLAENSQRLEDFLSTKPDKEEQEEEEGVRNYFRAPDVRPEVVRALVAAQGRHYRAIAALHPTGGDRP